MISRREFVRNGALAVAALNLPRLGAAESGSPEIEAKLREEVLALFDKVNPRDPATGRRKYVSFGVMSDIHKCKRIAGDDDPENPKKDYWYYWGAVLTDAEPSIRLLGSIAKDAEFDAILHAGDFSTANPTVAFAPGDYVAEIRNVKAMFDRYVPDVPFFTVDGNHDRNYWTARVKAGNIISDAEWAKVLAEVNTDVSKNPDVDLTYHRDLPHPSTGDATGAYSGNSYTLDFKRCLKTGGANVRLVCISLYDKCPGAAPELRAADGCRFDDPETKRPLDSAKTPENTVVGFMAHDIVDPFASAARAYLDANPKGRVFGSIVGHKHYAFSIPMATKKAKVKARAIGITNCNCRHGVQSREAYKFALLVVDTDKGKLHVIQLAGGDKKNPKYPNRKLRPNTPRLQTWDMDLPS